MRRIAVVALAWLSWGSASCRPSYGPLEVCGAAYCLSVGRAQTVSGVGAAQGVEVRDGLVWIYGDATTGIARGFSLDSSGALSDTDAVIALTAGGEDRAPHPTGLTGNQIDGTFLGNTVQKKGEILILDWAAARAAGTLDGAVLHRVTDGAATNGSRPELVRAGGRWLVASADYGRSANEIRLYDPLALASATDTSAPGVVVARFASTPYVQSLHYWEARDMLVLVQNRSAGRGWRLTLVDLPATLASGEMRVLDVLEPGVPGELEGFHFVDDCRAVMVTSASSRNAWIATLAPKTH